MSYTYIPFFKLEKYADEDFAHYRNSFTISQVSNVFNTQKPYSYVNATYFK